VAVRHVRRVEPLEGAAAGAQHLAVGHRLRRAVGERVHRHHGADLAGHGHGAGRGGQELVQRAALVGLEVGEGEVADRGERQDLGDRLGDERKESPPPVWPYAEGNTRGYALAPLYRTVPEAALRDPDLYQLLALADAIRDGRARERSLAEKALEKRLRPAG
jgi:hypothetical protein